MLLDVPPSSVIEIQRDVDDPLHARHVTAPAEPRQLPARHSGDLPQQRPAGGERGLRRTKARDERRGSAACCRHGSTPGPTFSAETAVQALKVGGARQSWAVVGRRPVGLPSGRHSSPTCGPTSRDGQGGRDPRRGHRGSRPAPAARSASGDQRAGETAAPRTTSTLANASASCVNRSRSRDDR